MSHYMHCLYRSNMHVWVLQTGVGAAVIYRDDVNEAAGALRGSQGHPGYGQAQGGHLMTLRASQSQGL